MTSLLELASEPFVSLTTFRKTGEPVSTAVWIAQEGDALIVSTGADSGKVKRLRNDSRVELRPSDRAGKVADDAPVAHGVAALIGDTAVIERSKETFLAKYKLQYRLFLAFERVTGRSKHERVQLRITAS